MELQGRLGALAERNFRLVFSSTSISALGDGVTTGALAFAAFVIEALCFTAIITQRSVWAIRSGSRGGWEANAQAAA